MVKRNLNIACIKLECIDVCLLQIKSLLNIDWCIRLNEELHARTIEDAISERVYTRT